MTMPAFLPIAIPQDTDTIADAVVFRYELAAVRPAVTSGAWRTVALNANRGNTAIATVAANVVTIQSGYGGKFLILGWTNVGRQSATAECQIVCSVVGTVRGTSSWSGTTNGAAPAPVIHTVETLADSETIEFQHQVGTSTGTFGNTFGGTSVYAELMFVKLS